MTRDGHRVTGVAIGLVAASLMFKEHQNLIYSIVCFFIGVIGGSAPDWLEVYWWHNGIRRSLIKHRTITHWLPLWVIFTIYCWMNIKQHELCIAGFGFGMGGLMHLAMDIPNPMGVPIIHPWKRFSFKWWKSGENEVILALVTNAIAVCISAKILNFY